jgi:hypothetical protein
MTRFTITRDVAHRTGDRRCPVCAEDYPEPCRCGGLVHAEASEDLDADGNPILTTRCDTCGRSEDQLDEV